MVPWVGLVELRSTRVPFREPPESYVTVKDFAPCGDVLELLRQNDQAVIAALRSVGG
jgi:hypothetical protein